MLVNVICIIFVENIYSTNMGMNASNILFYSFDLYV